MQDKTPWVSLPRLTPPPPCAPYPCTLYPASTFGCGRGLLLQHRLPLPQSLADGKAGDHAVDLGSPLAHVVLDVEDKRLLAEVGVYDFTWSLKPHSGVQIRLENTGLGGLVPTVRGVTEDGGGQTTTKKNLKRDLKDLKSTYREVRESNTWGRKEKHLGSTRPFSVNDARAGRRRARSPRLMPFLV